MRCRQHHYHYTLLIHSQRSCEDWLSEKFDKIVAKTHWSPSADVYETKEKIYITIEIAGVDPEKMEISLYDDALVVEGRRYLAPVSLDGMYHMAEIRQGNFCFEVPLTIAIQPEQIHSHYNQGLLLIEIKKKRKKSK